MLNRLIFGSVDEGRGGDADELDLIGVVPFRNLVTPFVTAFEGICPFDFGLRIPLESFWNCASPVLWVLLEFPFWFTDFNEFLAVVENCEVQEIPLDFEPRIERLRIDVSEEQLDESNLAAELKQKKNNEV